MREGISKLKALAADIFLPVLEQLNSGETRIRGTEITLMEILTRRPIVISQDNSTLTLHMKTAHNSLKIENDMCLEALYCTCQEHLTAL